MHKKKKPPPPPPKKKDQLVEVSMSDPSANRHNIFNIKTKRANQPALHQQARSPSFSDQLLETHGALAAVCYANARKNRPVKTYPTGCWRW